MSTQTNHAAIANPAPLGLIGFGMTTCLLQLHNVGVFSMSVAIIALGIAMGGLAQVIAGIMEFRNGNTFGATAFTSYGLFWWSLCVILVNPFESIQPADGSALGWYFILWGIFTLFLFIGTLRQTRSNQIVFGTLMVLFFLLAASDFSGQQAVTVIAGVEGLVCGASAIYGAVAQVVNECYDKQVMPL
jgi:succinate-acetate transporter protein